MPDRPELGESIQRAVKANLRFYEGLGQLTTEYLRSLSSVWGDLGLPLDLGTLGRSTSPEPPAGDATSQAAAPALVLEAAAGEAARGVFAVNNLLGREVTAPVEASPLRGPAGEELRAQIEVRPEQVSLPPGGQVLVEIVVGVTEELAPGVSYRGEVTVPGLSRSRVPLIVRRRQPAAPEARSSASAGAKKASGKTGRKRSSRSKSAGRKTAVSKAAARRTRKTTSGGKR